MTHKNKRHVALLFGETLSGKAQTLGHESGKLAEMVGISQESLSRMEKGVLGPLFERLQLFADSLQCTIADLFQERATAMSGQSPLKDYSLRYPTVAT